MTVVDDGLIMIYVWNGTGNKKTQISVRTELEKSTLGKYGHDKNMSGHCCYHVWYG